jgi:eukaryotic-like serine/threonine-protein kinase
MPFNKTQSAYIALRDQVSERTRPLVAWLGAGLSAQAGLPGWQKLKDLLVEAGLSNAKTMEREARTKREKQINAVLRETNLWRAFSILRDAIGVTTYQDEIRRALANAPRVALPETYRAIWNLPLRGVFNLNIDRLATRAFYEIRRNALPNELTAEQLGGMTHILGSVRPFIANLHGNVEQVGTWVFTEAELNRLLSSQPYLNFVRTSISTSSLLFVGITADDRAVGGHLEWLAKNYISTGPHFWLTDRVDGDTDRWAEAAGIRLIRYGNPDGKHREIEEFFHDLLSYVPQEDLAGLRPVVSKVTSATVTAIPDAETLSREPTEKIREVLNSKARELLATDSASSYSNYEKFCDEYDEAIHRAWYLNPKGAGTKLLSYTLLQPVERGAFGQVYKGIDQAGNEVAIKVLHEEVRTNADLLRSFRRGVKSMRILQQRHALGMVEYKDASEIPAFVVMEWINGPNLSEAIKGKLVDSWAEIVRIAKELAHIIGAAHALPERVLHRDLRPANIMLKGFYDDPSQWQVAVLDFDLSWHRGAIERSVLHSTALGYLAPEQLQHRPSMSTRHAAVDSYGLGMTLYFMCSRSDPIAEQHRHVDWQQMLQRHVVNRRCTSWRSLPKRVARLIDLATQDDQAKRLDMGQIEAELARLQQILEDPSKVQSLELIAEEIGIRADSMSTYDWNMDRGRAEYRGPSGMKVELGGDELNRTVDVRLDWETAGMVERKRMADLVNTARDRVAEKLSSGGWTVTVKESLVGGLRVAARVDRAEAVGALDKLARALDGAVQQVRVG